MVHYDDLFITQATVKLVTKYLTWYQLAIYRQNIDELEIIRTKNTDGLVNTTYKNIPILKFKDHSMILMAEIFVWIGQSNKGCFGFKSLSLIKLSYQVYL